MSCSWRILLRMGRWRMGHRGMRSSRLGLGSMEGIRRMRLVQVLVILTLTISPPPTIPITMAMAVIKQQTMSMEGTLG